MRSLKSDFRAALREAHRPQRGSTHLAGVFEGRGEVEAGMAGRVSAPGPKMGSDKQVFLDRAAIFCLPSYDEGLPMSMLEAMAAGIPVVMTRVGAIPEVIEDGVNGLLYDAGDTDALSACLVTLLSDDEQARGIGDRGRETVAAEYSIAVAVRRLLDLYRSIPGCENANPAPENH